MCTKAIIKLSLHKTTDLGNINSRSINDNPSLYTKGVRKLLPKLPAKIRHLTLYVYKNYY